MTSSPVGRRRPPVSLALLLAAAAALTACVGDGEPHRPTPPERTEATRRRTSFALLGARDDPQDHLLVLDELRETPGVLRAEVDPASGHYVVVHDPRRLDREQLRLRVREIGRQVGRTLDPLFDDR